MELNDSTSQSSKPNSPKITTKFCQNANSLADNTRDIARTERKPASLSKKINRTILKQKHEPNIEQGNVETQANKAEHSPLPGQIELVFIQETFSDGNELDKYSHIKQDVDDRDDPILTALVDLNTEGDTSLLKLVDCTKEKSDEIIVKTKKSTSRKITNLRGRTQKRMKLKKKLNVALIPNSEEGTIDTNIGTLKSRLTGNPSENNYCNAQGKIKDKSNIKAEESDVLQEFLDPVESKKSKPKTRRKFQLTKEQEAERQQKQLERRTCTICRLVFAFPGGLRNHIRSKHTHEKPYSCEICGEQFSIQSSYSLHKRRHLGIKPHLCNLCGKTFLRKMDMLIHMRIHVPTKDKIRDVKCSFCSNVYTSKINLQKHMLTKHTDPRDWKHECSICHKKCFSRADLTLHTRQHNDDRKFKCVICGRGFFTKQVMSVHVRTHSANTPFNCQHCSNGYRSNEALQRHLLTVHGIGEEKHVSAVKYFCSVCQKGFRQRARLEQHLALHETGKEEYPFECKKCDKRYKARNYFMIHMIDKHNVFIDDDYFRTHFNSGDSNNFGSVCNVMDVSNKNSYNKQNSEMKRGNVLNFEPKNV